MEQKMSLQQAIYILDGFNLRVNADQFDNKALDIGIECIERCLEYEKLHQNNTWISVKDKLPTTEVEVLVYTKGKIITTAMYKDETIRDENSIWYWDELEYWNDMKYDEENDCYIIPEGWWECRHYNPDDVYNNPIDDEVLFWQPSPQEPKIDEVQKNKVLFDLEVE